MKKVFIIKIIRVLLFSCVTVICAKAQQLPDKFCSFIQTIQMAQLGDAKADVVMNTLDDNTIHVKIFFKLPNEVQQDDWQVNITPAFRPSFHWAPHLTPTDNHIIDQHIFRSPAMIVSDERHVLTVIPDLNKFRNPDPVSDSQTVASQIGKTGKSHIFPFTH